MKQKLIKLLSRDYNYNDISFFTGDISTPVIKKKIIDINPKPILKENLDIPQKKEELVEIAKETKKNKIKSETEVKIQKKKEPRQERKTKKKKKS
ncbi:MAG: hypothetical protein LBD41_02630 [Clostridiales Family XIII bacterium]|jgi:hypothetical protein|nr:hypothetical protein [Clostridiales Family XIII bacterium]